MIFKVMLCWLTVHLFFKWVVPSKVLQHVCADECVVQHHNMSCWHKTMTKPFSYAFFSVHLLFWQVQEFWFVYPVYVWYLEIKSQVVFHKHAWSKYWFQSQSLKSALMIFYIFSGPSQTHETCSPCPYLQIFMGFPETPWQIHRFWSYQSRFGMLVTSSEHDAYPSKPWNLHGVSRNPMIFQTLRAPSWFPLILPKNQYQRNHANILWNFHGVSRNPMIFF